MGVVRDHIMAGSALKRLMQEYKGWREISVYSFAKAFCTFFLLYTLELTMNPPEGIVAGPKSEDNFFQWEAWIT